MKEITLYREDNGQYSTSEAKQDDVSGVYVQKEHLTDLQVQNDELRASNERLKTALNLTLVDACNDYSCSEDFHDAMYEVLHETQAQSLAEVKAEAVMGLIASGLGFAHSVSEFESEWVYSEDDIVDYANKLKGGEL